MCPAGTTVHARMGKLTSVARLALHHTHVATRRAGGCVVAGAAPLATSEGGARPVVAEASVSSAPVAAELAKPQTISAPSNAWAQDDTEWAIQVGAYGDIAPARAAAQKAVSRIPELTERTHISIAPYRTGDHIMYRARLIGMSGDSAKQACKQLERRQIPCIAIAPDRVRQPQASDNNQTATRQP